MKLNTIIFKRAKKKATRKKNQSCIIQLFQEQIKKKINVHERYHKNYRLNSNIKRCDIKRVSLL